MEIIKHYHKEPDQILTIPGAPLKRIAVYYDENSASIDRGEIYGDLIGVFDLTTNGSQYGLDNGILTDELNRLTWNIANWDNRDRRERAAELFLELRGYDYRTITLSGSSQSEWARVIVYADKMNADELDIDAAVKTIRKWFRGEVYEMALEALEIYTAGNGAQVARWECDDAIGPMIFTDQYGPEDAAADYFGITNATK